MMAFPTMLVFYLEDEVVGPDGRLDPVKFGRASPVARMAARPEILLAQSLSHLAFKISRLAPEQEGRHVPVRLMMYERAVGEPAAPILYAEINGVTVLQVVALAYLDVGPFLRRILRRHPDLAGKLFFFTLEAPGADIPQKEERACCMLSD